MTRRTSGASPEAIDEAKHLFDPNALTLGFARRFATYKRPNLLLHNPERLLRLLSNSQRKAVRVELYADGINGGDPVREEMNCAGSLPDGSRRCVFHATVPAAHPASDYTARVIPQRYGVAIRLEFARILWQR